MKRNLLLLFIFLCCLGSFSSAKKAGSSRCAAAATPFCISGKAAQQVQPGASATINDGITPVNLFLFEI